MKFAIRLLTSFLSLLSTNSYGQSDTAAELRLMHTFADAENLETLIRHLKKDVPEMENHETLKSIHEILTKNYYWNKSDKRNFVFTSQLKLNSMFKDFDLAMGIHNDTTGGVSGKFFYPKNEKPVSATTSFFSEAAIINAAASFMAKRAKQELLYYAIDKIFSICEDTTQIGRTFSTLLPLTKSLVNKLKKVGVYYASDFDLIRQMIEIDVLNLPENIPTVISKDKLTRDLLRTTGKILLLSKRGDNIPLLIDELGNRSWENEYYASSMKSMQLLSNSVILKKGTYTKWVEDDKFLKLNPIDSSLFQKIFYGLLLQQLIMQEDKNINKLLSNYADEKSYAKFSKKMYTSIEVVQNFKKIDAQFQDRPKEFDINWVLKTTDQFNTTIFDFLAFTGLQNELKIPPSIRNDISLVTEMTKLIYSKNYQGALTAVILKLASDENISPEQLRKLIFFIELSKVKTADEFEKFMTTYAAPIGSSAIKRSSKCNITLNGYVGLNGGYEFIKESKTKDQNNSGFTGVTAPIGVAFTFGSSKSGSTSFFISALDLGSLVNIRFKGDSTNYSKLRFEHFFTPGIGILYNIRKSPLTIGVFGNYISNVRNIEYTSGTTIITEANKSVYRVNLSLLIDIPFYTIYNRNKK